MADAWKLRGSSKAPRWTGIVAGMSQTMNTTVKRRLPEYPKRITNDWDHQPDFPVKREDKAGAFRLVCLPAGQNRWFWIWTTRGTKEHDIVPVNAQVLAFPSIYTPRTQPGSPPGFGGSGASSGSTVFAAYIEDHPGTTPRRFVGAWVEEVNVWFAPVMQAGVVRSARKA